MPAYGFKGNSGAVSGPGGTVMLGGGAGHDAGGVSFQGNEGAEVKRGADKPMTVINANRDGTFTARFQPTSPQVEAANALWRNTTGSGNPSQCAQDTITFTDVASGTTWTCTKASIRGPGRSTYNAEGEAIEFEWVYEDGGPA